LVLVILDVYKLWWGNFAVYFDTAKTANVSPIKTYHVYGIYFNGSYYDRVCIVGHVLKAITFHLFPCQFSICSTIQGYATIYGNKII